MILIIDMNWKKDSLGFYEFVLPIVTIAKTQDECIVKHFLEVTNQDLSQCERVILSGTALKDTATLSQPEKFIWLKETEKPVLGICAGMETIGVVFGMRLDSMFGNRYDTDKYAKRKPAFLWRLQGLLTS